MTLFLPPCLQLGYRLLAPDGTLMRAETTRPYLAFEDGYWVVSESLQYVPAGVSVPPS